MSRQQPIHPDPMPLREALRRLRFMLRRGGETLKETVSFDALPKPAADLAGVVLREVSDLARNIDGAASGLAKSVLGGAGDPSATLETFGAAENGGAQFAMAVYVALQSVLGRLGAPNVFVSEASARRVYDLNTPRDPAQPASHLAASLTLELLDARVMRGTTAEEAARVPGSAREPVAIFAVMLWLQSARSDAENEAALDAATDLAVALAAEVSAACNAQDTTRIAALYEKYAPHV